MNGWYDIVSGPVAAFWKQRSPMADSDQVSFHTQGACKLLTDLMKLGCPNYDWNPVK
jgi:hypothetical protein